MWITYACFALLKGIVHVSAQLIIKQWINASKYVSTRPNSFQRDKLSIEICSYFSFKAYCDMYAFSSVSHGFKVQ